MTTPTPQSRAGWIADQYRAAYDARISAAGRQAEADVRAALVQARIVFAMNEMMMDMICLQRFGKTLRPKDGP